MRTLWEIFVPHQVISKKVMATLIIAQVIAIIAVWWIWPASIIPKPMDIVHAFGDLWMNYGLGYELWTSFILNIQAIIITLLISLFLSYLVVLPFFRPIAAWVSKGRFLGLVGLTFLFPVLTSTSHQLKISLLVFGMVVFYVTSMVEVVAGIPRDELDYARTLRMGNWRVVWEVIVLGKIDVAIEILRQVAAIGWMMLTMVEGLARAEGGVGVLLLSQNKHFHLDKVFAIQISIFLIGIFQDYCIGLVKAQLCPYADITQERS